LSLLGIAIRWVMSPRERKLAIWRTDMLSGIDPSMEGTAAPQKRTPTLLESALRYERTPVVVLLVLLPVVSWVWIVVMARDMYGPMTGASAWMMTAVWDARHLALLWAMWAVMMVGMMLPSASPMLLLYGGVARRSATGASTASRQIYALAAGYLVVWVSFSLAATALQRLLATLLIVSPMMEVTSPVVAAALLLIAGAYQLTPIKHACLRTCQSPLGFLMSRGNQDIGVEGLYPVDGFVQRARVSASQAPPPIRNRPLTREIRRTRWRESSRPAPPARIA
jgi:hypothetical protein